MKNTKNWFLRSGYLQGAFWAIMINVVASANDVIMKYTGGRHHFIEVSFFRYLFSTLVILPYMFKNTTLFKTQHFGRHALRAFIGSTALTACCFSVNIMPLYENTVIMFSQPIFFLLLAHFLLDERVDFKRWLCTLFAFLGLAIVFYPGAHSFNWAALVPTVAAFLFAYSDIINKKMVMHEHTFTLLFYFGVGATLFSLVPLPWVWKMPTFEEMFFFALLGVGANLIQVCIFRAFTATDASGLAPFRYVELITGGLFGYIFFQQIPEMHVLYGAIIIMLSTFALTLYEKRFEQINA
ncbi:MAG: DMT family transporter [Alphaproteobacteria bacterium]|nr:MAG: DMT family transporter [Alphaproteobacteria bacterium]